MGLTMVEKIMLDHTDRDTIKPGQIINCRIDMVLGNDVTTPVAIAEFKKTGLEKVFNSERVIIVLDHFTPNKDIKSAMQNKLTREFAREQGIKYFYEEGEMGIEHCLLPEKGLALPGEIVLGADSHTCTYGALGALGTGGGSTDMAAAMATGENWFKVPETLRFIFNGKRSKWVGGKDLILYILGDIGVDGALYKSMEFAGNVISELPMDDRLTMSNMAVEAGGMCGLIAPDEITKEYLAGRAIRDYTVYDSDPDADFEKVYEYNTDEIEPQVAFPHLPDNVKPISEAKGIKIDQSVIGSCTNGRMGDLRIAAEIMKNKKVAKGVRCIVIPGTQAIYKQAMQEGLIDIFIDAGAVVSTPTCGPCLGGYMGILADGEKSISTTNRNFVGRMGHTGSEVYLSNPAVAAASAVKGKIAHPEEVL